MSSHGAALYSLHYGGRDLIERRYDAELNNYAGDVLLPWPNRIRDGKYTYNGKDFTVPTNESSRGTALHGLLFNVEWNLLKKGESTISFGYTLKASDGYPTQLDSVVSYALDDSGLTWTIESTNVGEVSAPYGVSIHPYLTARPGEKVDRWTLQLPSKFFMDVDSERLLPLGEKTVPEIFDFTSGKIIGDTFIDHAFLIDSAISNQRIVLTDSEGKGVFMDYSTNMKWIQIHTADRDGGAGSRTCLAVEPMTCPPDAFNLNRDVIDLQPGDSHVGQWRIGAF